MKKKLEQLKSLLHEITDLNHIIAILGWDQQTYMPEKGAAERGSQIETVTRIAHLKYTSDELADLVEELMNQVNNMDPDSDEACLIRKTHHNLVKQKKVSTEWVSEFARVTTVAQSVWEKARANSNFKMYQPHLEKIVSMRRDYAEFFAPYEHIYDPMLDDYEPGMKTTETMAIFNVLRPRLIQLIQEIGNHTQVDDSFLHQNYDEPRQWDFGVDVLNHMGFDWKRGRQDRTAHPFTNTFAMDDVRITTRFMPDYFPSALFSSVHEGGHALYELGFARNLARTPLADGASMAVHESQSRLWENLVARSLPFWKFFYPRLQRVFPAQLSGVDVKSFYQGINRVQPSLIRVESDEATYSLHIMLRLELEIAMLKGEIAVKDIPEAWNERMQTYLGITPPDDALGVLQDIHWAFGGIGYFPTYALGNVISGQIWQKINSDIPDLDQQMEKGKFSGLLTWLRENIHRYGAKYEPQDLVYRVTGSKITPEPYLNYLEKKYGQIYSL
ncbi:MAG: carboxypeptidase M32 [Anaerolineae bacterium]|nr:carboxypeptidase M32 [Anaerolineae bacterium]